MAYIQFIIDFISLKHIGDKQFKISVHVTVVHVGIRSLQFLFVSVVYIIENEMILSCCKF